MSTAHPNRSRRTPRAGGNPRPADIRALRTESGYTQTQFGRLVYRSMRIIQDWESGERRCPPDTWEYLTLLIASPEVRELRREICGADTVAPTVMWGDGRRREISDG